MIKDLVLGLRLAVGGGRMSGSVLLRLAMTAIGIGLAVAVLLPAASIGHLVNERLARDAGTTAVTEPRPGTEPLYQRSWSAELSGGDYINVDTVAAGGPGSPVPPGLARLPGPGELVVSPAVAELIASPGGGGVLARLPGEVIGTIGKPGLVDPDDMRVYSGASIEQVTADEETEKIYAFGEERDGFSVNTSMLMMLLPAAVALLLPLLIFVTTASRMGAAQRDRRLAALRLIGVDAGQIRRIAAAESLLGALAGLVTGAALFYSLRPLIGKLDLFGIRVFGEDFVPSTPLLVLIVLLVPVLAIGASIFGLRRTIVEPLGVVRHGKTVRRRMWWRWLITLLGAGLMLSTLFAEPQTSNELVMVAMTVGSSLLLIGVAVVLPWAVEKLVHAIRGGPPSWQFAIRRLQLDSGTASRVVSGLVVVLAGTILIQVLVSSVGARDENGSRWLPQAAVPVRVFTDAGHEQDVLRRLAATEGVGQTHPVRSVFLDSAAENQGTVSVEIGDCAALATRANVGSCADGDVFMVDAPLENASRMREVTLPTGPVRFVKFEAGQRTYASEWTVPPGVQHIPAEQAGRYMDGTLLVTPGAMRGAPMPDGSVSVFVGGPGSPQELSDRVAKAVNQLAWHAQVRDTDIYSTIALNQDDTIEQFRSVLLAASVFVLSVAALSLLMLSVEQISERRRPLAALSAAGVPLSVLAKGSLWQVAIPVLIGVVLAVAAGIGLTAPILRLADVPMALDFGVVGGLVGAALLAVLMVTALTLPLLRQVTRLDSLRAE
ncbi:FtsX-like permease family protein [Amycolatopsis nigrescens]|uniref:FtsX-like permease family protein n=1 Tax=Amycolatopsis nigrescens TaxID=381445 RepID=UPI000364A003|nr:FtsX-like permease family protein [Amycolatopsis nigrescens]